MGDWQTIANDWRFGPAAIEPADPMAEALAGLMADWPPGRLYDRDEGNPFAALEDRLKVLRRRTGEAPRVRAAGIVASLELNDLIIRRDAS